jgi:endonuclease/exonuclease/phosphatase family metal-dependent hydrolase
MPRLRVVTFNVFPGSPVPWLGGGTTALAGSWRLAEQIRRLRELDADVVCLQELYCASARDTFAKALGSVYEMHHAPRRPPRSHLLLFTALTCIVVVAAFHAGIACGVGRSWAAFGAIVAWRAWLRSALGAWLSGESYGLVTLVRRTLKSSSATLVFGHQAGDRLNRVVPRGYQLTYVGDVAIFNTHLNAGGRDDSDRLHQAAALCEAVCEARRLLGVTVVCGDLNAPPHAASVSLLRHVGGLSDTAAVSCENPRPTWCSDNPLTHSVWNTGASTDQRLDYVLVHVRPCSGPICVSGHNVLDAPLPHVSDHAGVLADIEWLDE